MSGIDERCQQLDDDLLNNFKARDADLDNRCEKIKQVRAVRWLPYRTRMTRYVHVLRKPSKRVATGTFMLPDGFD